MKYVKPTFTVRFVLLTIVSFCYILASCNDPVLLESGPELQTNSYVYDGEYNMVLVPIPPEGITFPVGIEDNDTATIDHAFYIGDSEVTIGLWYEVSDWATNKKEGERYSFIYFTKHLYYSIENFAYPMHDITYIQILVWCNAYTEWYNEKYGTHLTPVYVDELGTPIRRAMAPINPSFQYRGPSYHARLNEYLDEYPGMRPYIINESVSGTGFRLPTEEEWELAARWNGSNGTNTVMAVINGIDFSAQPIKFTKGNSASGANTEASNIEETIKYAWFANETSKTNSVNNNFGWYSNSGYLLHFPKTLLPNALGLYDMSGNLQEYTYHIVYFDIESEIDVWDHTVAKAPYPFARTKGGFFENTENGFQYTAVGSGFAVDATSYNYYYGLRIVRNSE